MNKPDINLRLEKSLNKYKTNIIKIIRPNKKGFFGVQEALGVNRLYQLRVGLSPLRSHKYRHNFEDTLTELCQCKKNPETTTHFLLYCENYIIDRTYLFNVCNTILVNKGLHLDKDDQHVKLFLYGHKELTKAENNAILKATLKFIMDYKRFDTP